MNSSNTDKSRLKPEKLLKWITHPLIHCIFWITLIALDYLIQKKIISNQVDMEQSLRNLFFVIVFVYTLIFFILPVFNKKKHVYLTTLMVIFWMILIISLKWAFLKFHLEQNTLYSIFFLTEFGRYFHFLILALLYFFLIAALKLDRLMEKSHAEKILLKSNLDQMILSPNFIFNCLESISSEFYPKAKMASQRLADFAELFSYTFSKNGSKFSTIQEELTQVIRFLEFQQYRFGENLTVKTDFNLINPLMKELLIPKMTIMTLVENMFKHGSIIKKESEHNNFRLRAALAQNNLKNGSIFIFHSQNPISKQTFKPPSHGIGIKTIKSILDHFYGNNYVLTTHIDGDIFNLNLEINYEENSKYRPN